ncbi:hypothetical protein Golax_000958 [Gossypium laxum]|uniref:Uncharacterized protein n=2 Tax=Gossypium TaxID=3633 RepID=A0A7J8N9Y8_9ROSI|nr:hypothetical protein [Gossypium lobatum]MBA0728023.1 hypothetical protein [Gossypium laxum]
MLHSILQAIVRCYREPALKNTGAGNGVNDTKFLNLQVSVLCFKREWQQNLLRHHALMVISVLFAPLFSIKVV